MAVMLGGGYIGTFHDKQVNCEGQRHILNCLEKLDQL